MAEQKKKEVESLNDLLYDNDLSIEELEVRLEMATWCVGNVECSSVCSPVVTTK
jgi:hypothetical protein